jgi:hypothetical protein
MKARWTINETRERTVEIKGNFAASSLMRKKLEELLNKKIEASLVNSRSKDNYSLAGWPYLQADSVGYERALKEVISLISEDFVE